MSKATERQLQFVSHQDPDTGAKVTFYTFYAGGLGSPTAIGEAGVGTVKQITQWHTSVKPNKLEKDICLGRPQNRVIQGRCISVMFCDGLCAVVVV